MSISRTRFFVLGVLPGLVGVDLINGALQSGPEVGGGALGSPAQLARGLVLTVGLLMALLLRAPELRPLKWSILTLALLGLVGPAVGQGASGSMPDLAREAILLGKVIYGPTLVLLLVVAYRGSRITLHDAFLAMSIVGVVMALSLIVGDAVGVGKATYPLQDVGFKGLFISQNDVGLTLGLSLFASMELFIAGREFRFLAACIVTIAAMVILGTRAASLGAIAAPLSVLVINAPTLLQLARRHWKVVLIPGIVLALLAGITTWEARLVQTEGVQQQRFEQLQQSQVVLVRGVLLIETLDYLAHRPLWRDVSGEGQMAYQTQVARRRGLPMTEGAAEVDWIDLTGGYGVLFTILVYGFYLRYFSRARVLRQAYGRSVQLVVYCMLGWFLLHSAIAGHAVTAVMAAGTLAPLLAYVSYLDAGASTVNRGALDAA